MAFDGFCQDLFGFCLVAPAGAGDFLVGLEVLVVDEEVLDFVLDKVGHVVDVLEVLVADVVDDAQQFVVAACFVGHLEHTQRAGLDDHTGEHGFGQDDQCVEGVAVFAEGVVDEAVVERVGHGGEQVAVEVDLAGFVVYFVLVAGAFGDFDGYFDAHGSLVYPGVGLWLVHGEKMVVGVGWCDWCGGGGCCECCGIACSCGGFVDC